MKPAVDDWPRVRSYVRYRILFGGAWLVYLAVPLSVVLFGRYPVGARLEAVFGTVAFAAVYLAYWARSDFAHPRPRETAVLQVILGLLAVALCRLSFGEAFIGAFVYVGALSGSYRRPAWMALSWALTLAAMAVLAHFSGQWPTTVYLAMTVVGVGFAVNGTFRLAALNAALREARGEVARLAAADERNRIARDLHDVLGHSLSVIAVRSELAARLASTDPARAASEMATVHDVARQALQQVRSTVTGYRHIRLDEELARSRQMLQAAGIGMTRTEVPEGLDPDRETVLSLVLREAVTNVLRHSRARSCAVAVRRTSDGVSLTVEDDGCGLPDGGARQGGHGLTGMAERLSAVGGRLSLRTGRGAVVEAFVPLDERQAALP
jgi:two-component system sensor histidine kinase DesK